VAKYDEALGPQGLETAALDVLESYAADPRARGQGASRRSRPTRRSSAATCQRTDLTAKIQTLRRELATKAAAARPPERTAPTQRAESRYELLAELGRGGMGVVYKARDKRLGRVVALKRLPENLREHPTAVELFEREARAAAALNHRNIVTIFDAGQETAPTSSRWSCSKGRALNDILTRAASSRRATRRGSARRSPRGCTSRTRARSSTATSRPRTCSSPRTSS
jgi:hypothetical protein